MADSPAEILRAPLPIAVVLSTCLLGAVLACAESPAIEGPPILPGDSWFQRADDIRVLAISSTNLPEGIPESALRLLHDRSEVVQPQDWVPSGEAIWRYTPTLDFGLALGPQWLSYEGAQVLSAGRILRDASELRSWHEPSKGLYVNWNPDNNLFRARKQRPTSALEFGFADHRNAVHSLVERQGRVPDLSQHEVPAAGLVCRATFQGGGADTRTVLYAPAPSRYRLDTSVLNADRLSFSVHTLKYGIHWNAKKRQLQRSNSNPGDGTTFAVEVGTGPKLERVWSRHVSDQEGFVEAEVDLRAYRGRPLRVELVTEGGPARQTLHDYGVWSGLQFQGASEAKPDRPHIFLVDIDTLRPDRLSVYGHRRDTTPRLKEWAEANALVYEHSAAASTWTLPSTASMLTGLTLTQHDVAYAPDALQAEHQLIAARLRREGYETYARVEGSYLAQRFGFDLGFDRYNSHRPGWRERLERGWKDELEFLRKRQSDRPLFFFLQTYMVHSPLVDDRRYEDPDLPPYRGPLAGDGGVVRLAKARSPFSEADWRYVDELYDASVARMDDVVMHFIEGLEEIFADEPFLLIFTSDHGEEFNEHGALGHGRSLYEETARVPLIVRFPDRSRVGRSQEPTSGLDLVPTILDFARTARPAHLAGLSLRNEVPPKRLRIVQLKMRDGREQDGFWRLDEKSILYPRGAELFDLSKDPGEQRNLAKRRPKAIERYRRIQRRQRARFPRIGRPEEKRHHLSQSLREELEAIGYVIDP